MSVDEIEVVMKIEFGMKLEFVYEMLRWLCGEFFLEIMFLGFCGVFWMIVIYLIVGYGMFD